MTESPFSVPESYQFLQFEQEKAGRLKLEQLAQQTGFSETKELHLLQQRFLREQPQDTENIRSGVNAFFDLAEPIADQDPTERGRLGLNILLVRFYAGQKAPDLVLAFEEALADAKEMAYQMYEEDILNGLITVSSHFGTEL